MNESSIWLYLALFGTATTVRLAAQAINAGRKDRVGGKAFIAIMASVAAAGMIINHAFLFLVVGALPAFFQQVGFHVFTSVFLEITLTGIAVKLGFMLSPRGEVEIDRATSYTCNDGHVVRSRGEALIDNWLCKFGIAHDYEKTISLGGNPVKYDWYLTDIDVFAEYWGYHGKNYQERRKEKERLYALHGKRLLSIEDKDLENVNVTLKRKLSDLAGETLFSKPARCFNCGVTLDERYT